MAEGPFPEHYEPFETPLGVNPMHPNNPKATSQSGRAGLQGRPGGVRQGEGVPVRGTTYRLTEHFHYWTKHSQLNAIMQPEPFVEIGEELAKEKGISTATRSRCAPTAASSRRVAVVTKRIKALDVDGKKVHTSASRSTGASRG